MKQPYSTSTIAKTQARVYRMYDKDGVLLYVGCSLDIPQRLRCHRSGKNKHWFREVCSITMGEWKMREYSLRDERKAINTEKPLYNALIPKHWTVSKARPKTRVLKALLSHTTTLAIAKGASVSEVAAREILYGLHNVGVVDMLKNDCWALKASKRKVKK